MVKILLAITCAFALVSCGGGKNPDLEAQNQIPDATTVGQSKYVVLDGEDTLKKVDDGDGIEGTGKIAFVDTLSKPETANNFELSFKLAVGGSVTLHANGVLEPEAKELTKSVAMVFARPEEGKPLKANVIAGSDNFDISEFVADIDPAKDITLSLDVHNDHGPSVHFLIWINEGTPEEKKLIDDIANGRGFGTRLGLDLKDATVMNFAKGPAKDEH